MFLKNDLHSSYQSGLVSVGPHQATYTSKSRAQTSHVTRSETSESKIYTRKEVNLFLISTTILNMPVWSSTYEAKVAELQAALQELRKKDTFIAALKESHMKRENALVAQTKQLKKSYNTLQESCSRKMKALKDSHKEKIALLSENEKVLLNKNSALDLQYSKLQKKVLEMKGVITGLQEEKKRADEYRQQLADKIVMLANKDEELNASKRQADIAEGKVKSLSGELQEEKKKAEELRQQLVDVKADLKQTKTWFDAHVAQSGVNFARSVHNVLEQASSGKKGELEKCVK